MEKQVSVGSWINVWVNEFSKKPKNKKISNGQIDMAKSIIKVIVVDEGFDSVVKSSAGNPLRKDTISFESGNMLSLKTSYGGNYGLPQIVISYYNGNKPYINNDTFVIKNNGCVTISGENENGVYIGMFDNSFLKIMCYSLNEYVDFLKSMDNFDGGERFTGHFASVSGAVLAYLNNKKTNSCKFEHKRQ